LCRGIGKIVDGVMSQAGGVQFIDDHVGAERAPWLACVLEGSDFTFRHANDSYMRTFGRRELIGRTVMSTMPELEGQAFLPLLRQVRESGRPYSGEQAIRMDWTGSGVLATRRTTFTYAPVFDGKGRVSHISVEGRIFADDRLHLANARERLERMGVGALSDRELLTLLLHDGGPDRASQLLWRFGSLRGVLAASPGQLTQITTRADDRDREATGLSEVAVLRLRLVDELHRRVLLQRACERPLLSTSRRLHSYLRAALADQPREQFRVLFLDYRHRLIRDEVTSEGTHTHCAVYTREIMRRALELAAHALILVHNHPSRLDEPSWQDCRLTGEIVAAAAALGIEVHDHLIIAGDKVLSLRRLDPERFRTRSPRG
jgi:DNA repair protein RadC